MNRKRKTYDRINSGLRIQNRRNELHMTQDELGKKIDRACKYVSDIERGKCGMSIETAISFAEALDTTMDYIILGKTTTGSSTVNASAMPEIIFESMQDLNRYYNTETPVVRDSLLRFASAFANAMKKS